MGEEAARPEEVAQARVAGAQLFLHEALAERVDESAAAVLLRKHERGDADVRGALPDVPRDLGVSLVDLARDRPDLLVGERADHFDDGQLLGGERHQLRGQVAQHPSCSFGSSRGSTERTPAGTQSCLLLTHESIRNRPRVRP